LLVINEAVAAKSGTRGAAWRQSPGYDLRRTRRDLPGLTRNAAHGGINQRFPNQLFSVLLPILAATMITPTMKMNKKFFAS
jgi:hypothetical protein